MLPALVSLPSMNPTSTAAVATARPERYAKQLVAHMGRKVPATWDETSGTGRVSFPAAELTLRRGTDALLLELRAESVELDRWEDVVGRHLVRFGTRDELIVSWRRADGNAGTTQRRAD